MILTDTHTHIYYLETKAELQAQIDLCVKNNVKRLFLPNVDETSIAKIESVCKTYPNFCFPMLGLHPCDVNEKYEESLQNIKDAYSRIKPCAIGEIGIDLFRDKTFIKQQTQAFDLQITWAKENKLPINIHCRDAFDEVFEVLENHKDGNLRGILHCFTGNLQQAQKVIDFGLYLGIGGVVTYKNSGLDLILTQLNLENLVLETDSPYLAPVPFRGKPNQSAYLVHIAQKIADIYQTTLQNVAKITTQNSLSVFKI